MKIKAFLRASFSLLFLLLLIGTVVAMIVLPGMEADRIREEMGDPLAFVTTTARDPWICVDEEGKLDVYHDDCAGMTVLRVPESVNGVTVTKLGDAFSTKIDTLERIIFPATVACPEATSNFSKWTALQEVAFREGCTDLSKQKLSAKDGLTAVYLPASLEKIGGKLLAEGEGNPIVYYAGTEEEWLALGADALRITNRYTVVYETAIPTEWLESTK